MSPTEEEKRFESKVLKILEGEKCTLESKHAFAPKHEGCAYNRSDIHEMFFQLRQEAFRKHS